MRIIHGKVHTTTKNTEFGSRRGDEKRKRRAEMIEKIQARYAVEDAERDKLIAALMAA